MYPIATTQGAKTLTPKEVADRCGVKVSTVHAWISRKEINSIRIGRRRFMCEEDIYDLYARRRNSEYVDMRYAPKTGGVTHVH